MKTNEEFKHTEITSQNKLLMKVLRAGLTVNRYSFKNLCRDFDVIECERLASRVYDCKKRLETEGFTIKSQIIQKGIIRYAEYHMEKL